jgi:uncharacterized metal-binding protein YceD (DUF177 family)
MEVCPYDARPMANPLTDRARPSQLAESGQVIETKGKLSDLLRLREAVEADLAKLPPAIRPKKWRHAPIDIRLAFGWADARQQIAALEGQISARIDAVCQRCLEPFELSLNAQLKFLLPTPDGEATALEEYEIWETAEDTVRPLDIVDEALIMAMPYSPTHDDIAKCGPLAENLQPEETKTVRPFAGLKSQMRDTN